MTEISLSSRKVFLYLDACIVERCNLTCSYCRDTNSDKAQFPVYEDVCRTVDQLIGTATFAVLKTSGYGEITLWPQLERFLSRYSDSFPTLQLITNGLNTRRIVDLIRQYKHLVPCVTLDGISQSANVMRTKGDKAIHERILSTLESLAELGRVTEVNTVLGPWNIRQWPGMVEDLAGRHPGGFYFLPFPHRAFGGVDFVSSGLDQHAVEAFAVDAESIVNRFPDSVPPWEYFEAVLDFLRTSSRRTPCYIHESNCGLSPALRVLRCACANESTNSQFQSNDLGEATELDCSGVTKLRFVQISEGRVNSRCSECLNHYELANLYLSGTVPIDRFVKQPSFRNPAAACIVSRVKDQLDESRRVVAMTKTLEAQCEWHL